MRYTIALVLAMVGLFVACAAKAPVPVAFQIPMRHIDYMKEVKPLLDKRCAVCHSCYNSPCQLKLDSFEGADRGATKRAVYNASRLRSMDPTRLFTDAQSTKEWRQKEFFSVTDSKASGGLNDSIMIELLSHKMKNPKSVGEYRSEADDLTCSGKPGRARRVPGKTPEPRHALRISSAQAGRIRYRCGLAGSGREGA